MPSNTARIAKNTLLLYFRQILILLVSLYTVSVVLETLGAEDYGIYNVVGGIVILFTFLNRAMTNATQRFLNYAMGQNDLEQVRNIFSISFIIHVLISILIIILAETIGLWFFYTWLNIPSERFNAAFFVYQFSIAATVINILHVPYRATIIAYEKMSFFAFLSIIEVVLKLGIVFLLPLFLYDNLIVYAFLVCITGIITFFIYKIYCNRIFETARFLYCGDRKLFHKLLGFSGWNAFGGVAIIIRNHGVNILVNIFNGVTVNAAMGIATQVNSAIYQFVGNFQIAYSPQIIKSYSNKDYKYFLQLIFRASKASFCLLFIFLLPVYLNTDFVLQIWLGSVPEYTVAFTRLILLFSLAEALGAPLRVSVHATGDIKTYQLILNCFVFANLPLSFLFLRLGFSPVIVLVMRVILNYLAFVWYMFFCAGKIKLPVRAFFREVIAPVIAIVVISFFATIFIQNLFINNLSRLIVSCSVSSVCITLLMYLIGLNKDEKLFVKNWIKKNK